MTDAHPDPDLPTSGVDPREIDAGARQIAGLVALLFAGAMHLVVGGFVGLSGRLAPSWAVGALALGWLAFGLLIWRWHRRRPLGTLLLPFLAAGGLWGVLAFGEHVLDWNGM